MNAPAPDDGSDAPDGKAAQGVGAGDVNDLFGLAYAELRGLASKALSVQSPSHTLQPTALVHEVWLKLSKGLTGVSDREHFLAVAARAMRQVLQDHARGVNSAKRGGRSNQVLLVDEDASPKGANDEGIDAVVLVDILDRLKELNKRHAEITELRILGGLTMPEVAKALGVSTRTVEGDWVFARAWLRAELSRS